jgi:hypothetical protein
LEIAGGKRRGPGFGIIAPGNYRYHAWYELRNNRAGDVYNVFDNLDLINNFVLIFFLTT